MKIQIMMGFALPVPALEGGAVEKRWHGLAGELAKRHEVTMFSCRHPRLADEEHEGQLRHVRLGGFGWSNRRWLNAAKSVAWSWRVSRRLEPADVLIINDVAAPVLLPYLRKHLGRVCIDVQRMPKLQYRFLYGAVDRFYCVSAAIADEMARVAPVCLPRCRRLPNSTDTQAFAPGPKPGGRHARHEILYVGRIHPEKGLDVLLRAVPLCRNRDRIFLRLVGPAIESSGGDPAFAEHLRATAAALGLTANEWSLDAPVFDDQALANVYRSSDIFVYPSRAVRGEASPIAPLEAMACGKPCLVSGLACFRDTVHDGENGLVVHDCKPSSWAAAFDRLIDDPIVLQQMGDRSRSLALDFRIERIAARLEEDLSQLVAAKSASGLRIPADCA